MPQTALFADDPIGAAKRTDPVSVLEATFGYKRFRGLQEQVVTTLIDGGDALVLMPTGGGKSLCYQIPALIRPGVGVVVSPLIALMQDQVDALRAAGVNAAFLNSTLDWQSQIQVEDDMRSGALDLIYIAPERLVQQRTLSVLKQVDVALFAIDEAHCVSQWGHDFRPEYRQLRCLAEHFANVPRVALTATADQRTQHDIRTELGLEQARAFVASFDRPNIRYTIADPGLKSVRERLWRFISQEHPTDAGIIYCLSRKSAEETANWLTQKGRTALSYHAGHEPDVRRDVQRRFLNEDGLIVVATIAFGMGIDKPDVRFVAHLNLPKSIEAYYQETGRAGRDGNPANAWLAYGMQDIMQQRQWIAQSDADETHLRVQRQKLDALIGLCEAASCRRKTLLAYFDESKTEDCGNCDNCLNPPETQDATTLAQKALSTVYRTDQRFGVTYLINVLIGKGDARITANGHDRLNVFGIGEATNPLVWRSLFRQLAAAGFLTGDADGHGTLQLQEAARPLLRGETTFRMRLPRRDARTTTPSTQSERRKSVELEEADQQVFEALRVRRAELAKAARLPPYIVAQDRTLIELATKRPATELELHDISGLGESKIRRYGAQFLAVIEKFSAAARSPTDAVPAGVQAASLKSHVLSLCVEDHGIEEIARLSGCEEQAVYDILAGEIEAGRLDAETVLRLDAGVIDDVHRAFEHCSTLETGDVTAAYHNLEQRYPRGLLECLLAELA